MGKKISTTMSRTVTCHCCFDEAGIYLGSLLHFTTQKLESRKLMTKVSHWFID